MTNSTSIQRNVMRRVHLIHAVRPLMSNTVGAVVLLALSLYLLGREVFVAQIFRNLPEALSLRGAFGFFESAFFNTSFAVQLLTVLAALASVWLVRECVRLVGSTNRSFA